MEKKRIGDYEYSAGLGGLCNATPIAYQRDLELFEPPIEEYVTYWAFEEGKRVSDDTEMYKYTPLRQTIILLICAMNNEI